MTSHSAYPQPRADRDNQHFLDEWRDGRLAFQACGSCGHKFFYPRPLCPHCWSDQLTWMQAEGRGQVVSFSLVHRPNDPAFIDEAPIALAEIRIAEGPTLLARLVDAASESIQMGMPVRLVPKSGAGRFPLPAFTRDISRGRR